jgi:undecaprenyl pyrophosphate phosphatase UppP
MGDLAVESYHDRGQLAALGMGSIELLAGVVVAMVVGCVAIRLVSKVVASKRFHYFAFYTWALGLALIVLVLAGR